MRAAGALDSPDYPAAQIYAAGLLTAAALASAGRIDDAMLRAAFSDLRTTTMFGDFSIDRVTGRQLGHQMLLVQWHRGRKVIIVPESHDDSGSLDFPAGWRLLLAGFEALRLTRPAIWTTTKASLTIRTWTKMSPITIRLQRGKLLAIGLMSGTSHDGISAAVVELDERSRPPARLIAFQTFPYPARFRKELLDASADEKIGAAAISTLNFALGRELGRAAIEVAGRARIALSDVTFIGSHGHTFFHLPPRRTTRGQVASTLQLGESAIIAAATGVPVVADFRTMDVALGGEGAPLAPLAHLWLFADPKRGRVVQNIGGIANATYIPPRARHRRPRPHRVRHRSRQRNDRCARIANLWRPLANGSRRSHRSKRRCQPAAARRK